MAKGLLDKARRGLRGRQSQIERALDEAVNGGRTTTHEMVHTAPEGTKIHMDGYSIDTTKKMQQHSGKKYPWEDKDM